MIKVIDKRRGSDSEVEQRMTMADFLAEFDDEGRRLFQAETAGFTAIDEVHRIEDDDGTIQFLVFGAEKDAG